MIHLQIAEAGKRLMLARDHLGALARYRAALRLAVSERAPAVFLYHYTDCILDCLEASGDHQQALELTQRALDDHDPDSGPLGDAVRADLIQRHITLLYALGRSDDGDHALAAANSPQTPILGKIRVARRRQLRIDARWIAELKRRYSMSSVTHKDLRNTDADQGEAYFQKEFSYG